jgi:hypothetical protein
MDVAIPEQFISLGYTSKREFELLLIIRQLQLNQPDKPFYLSCRKAAEFIQYNHYGTSQIIDSFVSDGILEIIEEHTMKKATRYKYLWKDF